MRESFGARMRQKREEQLIALSSVADDTKIKLSLLEGLERDDMTGWPMGIFRRAYIRAYARAVGLKPDVVLREFLEVYPEPPESDVPLSVALQKNVEPESWRERIWQFRRRNAPESTIPRPDTTPKLPVATVVRNTAPPKAPEPIIEEPLAAAPIDNLETAAPPTDNTEVGPFVSLALEAVANEVVAACDEPTAEPIGDDAACEPQLLVEEPVAQESAAVSVSEPTGAPPFEPDLAAIARLCTQLGQVQDSIELERLLADAADLVDAAGLIVWIWDAAGDVLSPALAHGYPPKVLAHLRGIGRDSDNATATAFRSGELCAVNGTGQQNGALVAPLMRAGGCSGVLALEMRHGTEQVAAARAVVSIVAAQLAAVIDAPAAAFDADEEYPRPATAGGGAR